MGNTQDSCFKDTISCFKDTDFSVLIPVPAFKLCVCRPSSLSTYLLNNSVSMPHFPRCCRDLGESSPYKQLSLHLRARTAVNTRCTMQDAATISNHLQAKDEGSSVRWWLVSSQGRGSLNQLACLAKTQSAKWKYCNILGHFIINCAFSPRFWGESPPLIPDCKLKTLSS